MLSRSVENDLVGQTLPLTVQSIQSWDALSGELPDGLSTELLLKIYRMQRKPKFTPK